MHAMSAVLASALVSHTRMWLPFNCIPLSVKTNFRIPVQSSPVQWLAVQWLVTPNIYMHADLHGARSSKIVKSEAILKIWSTQTVLSYLCTLDMFLALVGFVVYIVDIHWQLVSYELHHESCCTPVPVCGPDSAPTWQKPQKASQPKQSGPTRPHLVGSGVLYL